MQSKKIVLLAGKWDTTPVVYNFLEKYFKVEKVILESPVPRKIFLKRRIRKLGMLTVSGQVLFQLLIAKPLKSRSAKRITEILQNYNLSTAPIPVDKQVLVASVNAPACLHELQSLQPDIVIVHGTRIISKKVLQSCPATFINIHAGITPRYRGSHGAYWALANNDKQNCGVTVHVVDAGIDTGGILFQSIIKPEESDNFVTYPYLQLAEGLIKLPEAVKLADLAESKKFLNNELNSALWHHPTLWGYLLTRIWKNVK